MKVSYYPGCSLHGTAREYDESTRAVAGALDIDLEELPDWNCCGASSAHATSESLALELAARNLAIAGRIGKDLVVPCAACFSRLKAAQSSLRRCRRRGPHQCSQGAQPSRIPGLTRSSRIDGLPRDKPTQGPVNGFLLWLSAGPPPWDHGRFPPRVSRDDGQTHGSFGRLANRVVLQDRLLRGKPRAFEKRYSPRQDGQDPRRSQEGGRRGHRRGLSPVPVEPRHEAGGACLDG